MIRITDFSFRYPKAMEDSLKHLSLSVKEGEFIILCGQSGCGKTTLLKHLKPCLSPYGEKKGTILFRGKPIDSLSQREQCQSIGYVMQNPDEQLVTDKVWHELAFGLESLGLSNMEIRVKVAEMATFFGIEGWFHRSAFTLSGGQKQLLNLASIMAMQPEVIILDEPTAQLDPIAAQEFLQMLKRINLELGTTVILAEHRLEDALSISDRVIVLDRGELLAEGEPGEVGKRLKEKEHPMFYGFSAPVRVHSALSGESPCPLTIREGRAWMKQNPPVRKTRKEEKDRVVGETIIQLRDVFFSYDKKDKEILKNLSLSIPQGTCYSIVGGNGTGKTTLLSLICGLLWPDFGKVLIQNQPMKSLKGVHGEMIGMLPQDPKALFLKETVAEDLEEMVSGEPDEKKERLNQVIELCELAPVLNHHPYDLSGGEQQRAALAKVLLKKPKILLLDEPTKGLDAYFKQKLAALFQELKKEGLTIVMVTHDIEFCARYADRCAMLFDGSIVSEGQPKEFFAGKSFYTTAANRMAREFLPDAVLVEDILYAYEKGEDSEK